MKALVLTSEIRYTVSTKKGVKTYSLFAREFGGYVDDFTLPCRPVKRAVIGQFIQIAKGTDKKKFDQYIKKCRAAGDIIELEGENMRYGIE